MANTNDPNEDKDKDKNQDRPNDSEENFGLPDIEYKPLEEQSPETPQAEGPETPSSGSAEGSESTYQSTYSYSEPEEKSKAPLIIGIVIGIVVIVAAFLIYQYVYKPAQERAKQEQLAQEKARQQQAAEAEAERQRLAAIAAENKRKADSVARANAVPPAGTIEVLSEQTGRYYVVISSAIDDDLLMDYAKKLSAKGVSTKIIPPFGKTTFSRITIGDYETFAIAQTNADQAKGTYGPNVWVVRY